MDLIKKTIRINSNLWNDLIEIAGTYNMSVASLVRQVLTDYVIEHKKK